MPTQTTTLTAATATSFLSMHPLTGLKAKTPSRTLPAVTKVATRKLRRRRRTSPRTERYALVPQFTTVGRLGSEGLLPSQANAVPKKKARKESEANTVPKKKKTRKENKIRAANRKYKEEQKALRAITPRPQFDVAPAQRPDEIDDKFHALVVTRVEEFVAKHGEEKLRFDPYARSTMRTKKIPFYLVSSVDDKYGRRYYAVTMYGKNFPGQYKTEVEAGWAGQVLVERLRYPEQCRNFDADGMPCYDHEAFLKLFKKFTSATPKMCVKSHNGLIYGTVTKNGRSREARPDVSEDKVAGNMLALEKDDKW